MGQGDKIGINDSSGLAYDDDDEYAPPVAAGSAAAGKSSAGTAAPPSGCMGGLVYGLTHPQAPMFRYAVLACCCFLTFGSYYSYDIPGASAGLIQSEYDITTTQYSLLYSIYSVPNMVLPFFGGYLVDRVFGLRLGGIIFCFLVLVGQWIFTLSSVLPNPSAYYVAILGRFVFGLGGESLSVVQSTFCAKWFKGNELALAFGITLSFSRIGSALNFLTVPRINDIHNDVSDSLSLGLLLCFVSMAMAIALSVLDHFGEKNADEKVDAKAEEKIALLDVLHFPLSIWFIYAICVTFYIGVFVFMQNSLVYFEDWFDVSSTVAGNFNSIPYGLAAIMSPIFGFTVDRVGRSVSWLFLGSISCAFAQMLMLYWRVFASPIVGMTIIGVAYSLLAASLWPCVALIVKGHELGTAYGLMTAIQNSGLSVAPPITGLLIGNIDNNPRWSLVTYYFVLNFLASAVLAVLLGVYDFFKDGVLNASAAVRKQRQKQKEDEEAAETGGAIERVIVDERGIVIRSEAEKLLAPRSVQVIRNSYLMRVGIMPPMYGRM